MTPPRTDAEAMARVPALVWGLIFGPSTGMMVALLFFGAETIGSGLSLGAGAGVALGAIVDALRARRPDAETDTGTDAETDTGTDAETDTDPAADASGRPPE